MSNIQLETLKKMFVDNYDMMYRDIKLAMGEVHIVFIKTITDSNTINEFIIEPLIKSKNRIKNIEILKEIIWASEIAETTDFNDVYNQLLNGCAIIITENSTKVYYCDVKKYEGRSIDIPPTNAVIKGPREGFTENLYSNISLVRKRIRDKELKIERIDLGTKSVMPAVIIYIENRVPKELLKYIKIKLNKMQSEYVLQSNFIREQLETKRTLFDTIGTTEKPDVFVAKIVEGRVGILMQGDSSALTVPYFFVENLQAPNDYAINKHAANYIRLVRWVALFVAVLLPGLFIALTTHHVGLLPRVFVFRLAINRAGVPFPAVIEFLVYMFLFQLLREAGVRLPQSIGQAISIVGALILGDAAIGSGLASQVTVLIVSLSSISTFLIPDAYASIIIWSDLIILASAIVGLPGFYISFIVFCAHLSGLSSAGYPYLYPLGTLKKLNYKDLILRGWLNNTTKDIKIGNDRK